MHLLFVISHKFFAEFETELVTNYTSVVILIKYFLPHLLAKGVGPISI